MVSVSEVFKAFDYGFANKDSSKLGKFFTDDLLFVAARRTMNKQEISDWTAGATRRSWVVWKFYMKPMR